MCSSKLKFNKSAYNYLWLLYPQTSKTRQNAQFHIIDVYYGNFMSVNIIYFRKRLSFFINSLCNTTFYLY